MKPLVERFIFLVIIVFSSGLVHAQFPDLGDVIFTNTIQNGSFEGDQYMPWPANTPSLPPPWIWCYDGGNTPDQQPGNWLVTAPPYVGENYAGMISKFLFNGDVSHENFAAPLTFQQGEDHFLTLHLANNLIQNNRDSSAGGRLQILLRQYRYCLEENDPLKDTIWVSEVIKGEEWQPQIIHFTPSIDKGFLVFEARPVIDSAAYTNLSNILIDGISGPFPGRFEKPDLGPDLQFCMGDTAWLESEVQSSAVTFIWQDGSREPRLRVTESGMYIVTFIGGGERLSDTINVTFVEPIQLRFPPDTLLCLENEFLLGPTRSDYEYYWSDGVTESPRVISREGAYHLRASKGKCIVSDSALFYFRTCADLLEMPNVFTPNGDGIHDVFQPMSFENIFSYQLQVFDRWGRVMANIGEISGSWDGTDMNGRPASEGVYFYSVQYQGLVSEEVKAVKGTVTLVR